MTPLSQRWDFRGAPYVKFWNKHLEDYRWTISPEGTARVLHAAELESKYSKAAVDSLLQSSLIA